MYMHNNHCHRVTAQLQLNILLFIIINSQTLCVLIGGGDRGSTVVKVLCYKSEGRWFGSI